MDIDDEEDATTTAQGINKNDVDRGLSCASTENEENTYQAVNDNSKKNGAEEHQIHSTSTDT